MKKKVITTSVLALALAMTGCSMVSKSNRAYDDSVKHFDYASDEIDFSEQAQVYMEYIGTNMKNRSAGISTQHDKARDWIVAELQHAGYKEDQISLQEIKGKGGENIILEIQGSDTEHCIIAGAHYDGDGVGDNASGVALLLATAVGLKQHELPVTTVFVFFDEEESGCFGSQAFVEEFPEDRLSSVMYFINIDAIAFGDYCNTYGGIQDAETKEITQTEIYEYACDRARYLGFNVYGTEALDGYFAEHGEGPALDPKGIFTNPWTVLNPAPENTVPDEYHAYSPTTIPASDHIYFAWKGIPYVYFEATSWYVPDPDNPDMSYIGYSDVSDVSLGENGCIMNTKYDNLDYLNEHFPGRSLEHFRLYSPILSELILEPYS